MTELTRRSVLGLGAGMVVCAGIGLPLRAALATPEKLQAAIMEYTGGVAPANGGMTLSMPEIAENGGVVPMEVSVDSAMADGDYVESVLVAAEGNPVPVVGTFNFSRMSGDPSFSTRIRLAQSQKIVAVAKMSDGSFRMAETVTKVTIGGCGG